MDRKVTVLIPVFVCVIIVMALLIWPADAPWGGDDVTLIKNAIQANQQHRLITAGLGGSFGYPYGPLPSQIYQLLAIFSHDPVILVRLHAGLFGVVTAGALLWLTAGLGLSAWLAPMAMLGPFFWFYGRLMWDNTFAMPIGTLLLAAYGQSLRRESPAAFYTALSCAITLPLIHPMTLPLVVAVLIHAGWRWGRAWHFADRPPALRRGLLKKYWRGLIVIAMVTVVSSGFYFFRLAQQIGHSTRLLPPRSDALGRMDALAFPLFAARLFCAQGFFDARGPEIGWEQNQIIVAARLLSVIAYPMIWLGMVMAIYQFQKRAAIPVICLGALLLQSLMDAALRISPYPHYFCGTWAAAVVMLWLGMDAIKIRGLKTFIGSVYALCLIGSTVAFAIDIHQHSGGSIWYGPSLGAQLHIHP